MAQIKRKFSNCPMTKEEEEGRAAQVFVLEMKICTGGGEDTSRMISRSWNDETFLFPETPRDVTALTLPPSSQFGRFSLAKTIGGVVSLSRGLLVSVLRTLLRSFPPTVRRCTLSFFSLSFSPSAK